MLTSEQITEMTANLLGIYEQIEQDLLVNIAKRFSVLDSITPDTVAEWQTQMLQELGALRTENYKIIAAYSGKTEDEIARIFIEAGFKSIETDETVYQLAFSSGILPFEPVPLHYSPTLQQILNGAIRNTREYCNLVNTTALQSVQREFTNIVNRAYLETSMGIYDYSTSVRNAVRDLADKGITGARYSGIDKNGRPYTRTDHMDVAMRRNIVTSTSQTAGKMQLERALEWGANLVEVSSHVGARPEHAEWQGGIYSIKGSTDEYPNLEAATGYGSVTGLKGVNCSHDFYPFFPGLSTQRYYPYDQEENTRVYQESQQQRRLEREIREQKRRILSSGAIKDTETMTMAQFKLREKTSDLKSLLAQTGRTQRGNRQQVLNFGHSQATSAVWAERKAYQISQLLIGHTTSIGVTVESLSSHFLARAIERDISPSYIVDSLINPLSYGKIRADGSQQFIGSFATTALNIESGKLVTIWPTNEKKRNKLKGSG